jgi:hypothetical protein
MYINSLPYQVRHQKTKTGIADSEGFFDVG